MSKRNLGYLEVKFGYLDKKFGYLEEKLGYLEEKLGVSRRKIILWGHFTKHLICVSSSLF